MRTPTQPLSKLSYGIDARDRLESIDATWCDFANKNGGEELAGESVLGKSLWDFISDQETAHLYKVLVSKVRRTGETLALPFRCDSPEFRRYLQLKMSPSANGGVQFVSETLREEQRRPIQLLNGHGDPQSSFLIICSWCKRIEITSGWVEAEFAIAVLGLFDESLMPQLSHAMCPDCRRIVEAQL